MDNNWHVQVERRVINGNKCNGDREMAQDDGRSTKTATYPSPSRELFPNINICLIHYETRHQRDCFTSDFANLGYKFLSLEVTSVVVLKPLYHLSTCTHISWGNFFGCSILDSGIYVDQPLSDKGGKENSD